MSRRDLVRVGFTFAAIVLAIIFSSLGFWQLRRLGERRAQNAMLSSRRFRAPIDLNAITADTASARFRRVRVQGAYDYGNEFALTLRTRNGSPGVDIITPVLRAGTDTVLLVNRGWIYAPDGMTAELNKWNEGDSVNAIGFVETFSRGPAYVPRSPGRQRAYRWLDRATIESDLHRPVAPFYIVVAPDSETGYAMSRATPASERRANETPPRVEPRGLDEGPHKSYAIQWFSFAAISILGLIFFLRRA